MATILIVNDSETVCDSLAISLKDASHRVICFREGCEAAAYLAAEKVNLIILDLHLADMKGLHLLAMIREIYSAAARPVLIYTASENHSDRDRAMQLGANAYVIESAHRTELLYTVERLIDKRPSTN